MRPLRLPLLVLSAIPLLAVGWAGCVEVNMGPSETVEGSGEAATRTHDADGVRYVSFAVPGELVITVGGKPGLRVEGDANLLDRLDIDVNGDELDIKPERGVRLRPNLPLRFALTVETLEGLDVAGSGEVRADGAEADQFELNLAGSGEVEMKALRGREVEVSTAGSGEITLSGEAERLEINIAGSGDVDAAELAVRAAEVSIAGSGDAAVRASDRLEVNVFGSGDVLYYGDPSVERSVMGSGDVTRADD